MKLMPTSKARSTQAAALSRSTPTPKVSQEPREISETLRSLAPSLRYFMAASVGARLMRSRGRLRLLLRGGGGLLLALLFHSFVVANRAAHRGAEQRVMMGNVADHAAHDRAFEAA